MSNLVANSALRVRSHAWIVILTLGWQLLTLDSVCGLCCNEAGGPREAPGGQVLPSIGARAGEMGRFGRSASRSASATQEDERRLHTLERRLQRISAAQLSSD